GALAVGSSLCALHRCGLSSSPCPALLLPPLHCCRTRRSSDLDQVMLWQLDILLNHQWIRFFPIENEIIRGVGYYVGLMDSLGPKDRKSTRLNSSHVSISYAVFCLKKTTKAWPRETAARRASRD